MTFEGRHPVGSQKTAALTKQTDLDLDISFPSMLPLFDCCVLFQDHLNQQNQSIQEKLPLLRFFGAYLPNVEIYKTLHTL